MLAATTSLVLTLPHTTPSATSSPSRPSLTPLAVSSANLFATHPLYINPANVQELQRSIQTASGEARAALLRAASLPSAYWIDRKAKLHGNGTDSLEGILADAAAKPAPPLVVFILYNLPNRDCNAKASNGEICCYRDAASGRCDYTRQGDCAEGLAEYKQQYVQPFAALLRAYHTRLPIAVVVEPDSLPNLATNAKSPSSPCGNPATQTAYHDGVAFAIEHLAQQAPSVALYLDAAHGGWLGWETGYKAYIGLLAQMGVAPYLRGFASNSANYQPLGVPCPPEAVEMGIPQYCALHAADACCRDPCGLLQQYNAANNELNYAQVVSAHARGTIGGFSPHWLIDTGRNGVDGMRSDCSNWCNIRGAGLGHAPTANTSLPAVVDAYFWLKTPGESDGCTQALPGGAACARYDPMCQSADSIGGRSDEPRAPEAGGWFDYEVKQLAANARFGGGGGGGLRQSFVGAPAKPFTPCERGGGRGCTPGYVCERGLCMPTAERLEEARHGAAFSAMLAHARRRVGS
ncbi:hypothetical protein AB1Y20_012468 [Prymnesium parvum]|uniref:Glucanase n=1 Tax=Prymnesium parvum TaxID=97485 RepID=A0AB34IKM6_PRYPA